MQLFDYMKQLWYQCLPLFANAMIVLYRILTSLMVTDQCVFCSEYGTRAIKPNSRQLFRLGTQYTMKHMLRHSYIVFMCLSHSFS